MEKNARVRKIKVVDFIPCVMTAHTGTFSPRNLTEILKEKMKAEEVILSSVHGDIASETRFAHVHIIRLIEPRCDWEVIKEYANSFAKSNPIRFVEIDDVDRYAIRAWWSVPKKPIGPS